MSLLETGEYDAWRIEENSVCEFGYAGSMMVAGNVF